MPKERKKLAARLYDAIFPRPTPPRQKRSYAAARSTRLNAGWTSSSTTANSEVYGALDALIARSRAAARDHLHIVNYMRLMRNNVVGQEGLGLQCRARLKNGRLNVKLNKRIEEAWWKWMHAETCTVSGLIDWAGVQNLFVDHCERDGAGLIQMVEAKNPFGFALKVWDITWLDPTFTRVPASGNRIVMSVELDADDRPVAYWMTPPASESQFRQGDSGRRKRIPADQIIHASPYRTDESQARFVPGITAALLPVKNAASYCESVIMASRFAVNQFAVLKNTTADAEANWEGMENDDGSPNHPQISSEPLAITAMLPGWELQQFKPDHPTQNHPMFKQTLDMEIAAALGVPYFLLMGDWKAVNFSSSRGGLGEFRERCRSYQRFVANALCRRVFNAWLKQAWLSGAIDLTEPEYRELQDPLWQPRGFDYVNPKDDIETDILALKYRLRTPSEIALERGRDYLDQLERWASDKQLAAEHGIDIDEIYTDKPEPPADPPQKANDPNGSTPESDGTD